MTSVEQVKPEALSNFYNLKKTYIVKKKKAAINKWSLITCNNYTVKMDPPDFLTSVLAVKWNLQGLCRVFILTLL